MIASANKIKQQKIQSEQCIDIKKMTITLLKWLSLSLILSAHCLYEILHNNFEEQFKKKIQKRKNELI